MTLANILNSINFHVTYYSFFLTTHPPYFCSKFNVRRQTQHLSIPYYVKENFENDYQGSLARLENSVEEDYVYTMKQHCFRERSYRKLNATQVLPY